MPAEYDEKFDLITGLLHKSVGGLDELRMDFRNMRKDIGDLKCEVRKNGDRLDGVDNKLMFSQPDLRMLGPWQ